MQQAVLQHGLCCGGQSPRPTRQQRQWWGQGLRQKAEATQARCGLLQTAALHRGGHCRAAGLGRAAMVCSGPGPGPGPGPGQTGAQRRRH